MAATKEAEAAAKEITAANEAQETKTTEVKAAEAAATKEAEMKETEVKTAEVKAEVVVQYRHLESNIDTVMERIYEQYTRKGYSKSDIEKIQVYIKPEDFTAYFVINDAYDGKVPLF